MTDPVSRAEWLATLPKKRSASGALFFNAKGQLLILEPVDAAQLYLKGWTIPGGMIDEGESPRDAAIRETREEIGLDVAIHRLLCLDYLPAHLDNAGQDSYQMMFDGGILSDDQIAAITLKEDEIGAHRFVDIAEAVTLLRPLLAKRLRHALQAKQENTIVYLENTERLA